MTDRDTSRPTPSGAATPDASPSSPQRRSDRVVLLAMRGLRVGVRTVLVALGLLVVVFAYLMNFNAEEAMSVLWRTSERYLSATGDEQMAFLKVASWTLLSLCFAMLGLELLEDIAKRRRARKTKRTS